MQEILEEYQLSSEDNDLFAFWQKEVRLRTAMRHQPLNGKVVVENREQLEFLYRALYYGGRKYDFFSILSANLHLLHALQWLVEAPRPVMEDFLSFLPWYILSRRTKAQDLEFIARIYHNDYHPAYSAVINVLDEESCTYLAAKTANPDLRQLLKQRQLDLQERSLPSYYGLDESPSPGKYPTFYGDKAELAGKTLKLLQDSRAENFRDPYAADRFLLQIQAAEMVFKCGLVADSLALLGEIYDDYQQKNRLVEIISDQKVYKGLNQLLRAVIPMYCLVYEPLRAYSYSEQLYREHFPLISPEAAPLYYLELGEAISAAYRKQEDGLSELFYLTLRIIKSRPAEIPLLTEAELKIGLSRERCEELLENSTEKLSALPHESFIILELMRLLEFKGRLSLDENTALRLLNSYMQLWRWLPCRLFMPEQLVSRITPRLDHPSRRQARQIIDLLESLDHDGIKREITLRPHLFRPKNNNAHREILLGKLMGVL